MHVNFKKLNLDIPFVRPGSDITKIRATRRFSSTSILNPGLIQLISDLGLKTDSTYVLYYSGSGTNFIHVDRYGVTDQTNLNFVLDSGSALTNWYHVVDEISDQQDKKITNDGIHIYNDITQLRLIESINTVGVGLFQAGVPHCVGAVNSPRWCVSVKLRTSDNKVVRLEEAVRIFDQFIVN
jgi:hypothetical protein